MSDIDEIRMQVMWNRLISVVEEQALTLLRTAFSTSVRESGDLSAGVFNPQGEMLAQAVTGTPGHVNTMAETVALFMAAIPRDEMFEGDTYVTNDPWLGTGHLHDITMVSPSFQNGELVAFFACTAACNEVGHQRLVAMMKEIGLSSLEGLGDFIFSRTRSAMRERNDALPKGSWSNELVTDGYDAPVRLAATVSINDQNVEPLGHQLPDHLQQGLCLLRPEMRGGTRHPQQCRLPEFLHGRNILNAVRPAPVALRHIFGHMVPDLVLGALAQALPGKILSEGAGALWNIHISARPAAGHEGRRAEVLMFNSGGMGARPGFDGLSATAFPSGVHTMPIEATEHTGPIVIWRKELRADSGGDGEFRGGLGQVLEIAPIEGYEFDFSAMFDRVHHAARGRNGGKDGAPGVVRLDDGAVMRPQGWQHVPAGRTLVLELPGGGGYGDPAKRAAEAWAEDRSKGYVSENRR
jgi:N-methylhydantoinase B